MYPTHAAVLRVLPREASQTDLDAHRAAVRDAVEDWLERELETGGTVTERDETRRDRHLRLVGYADHAGPAGEIREVVGTLVEGWAWEGWIERTLQPDRQCAVPRTLRTDLQMRCDDRQPGEPPAVLVTLREQLAFVDGMRSPDRQSEMAPPSSLLGALLASFRLFEGTIEWTRSYWSVSTSQQVQQLYERIVDPGRTVPLLVCVGDEEHGPPIDPAELGRALFGTARVVHITKPRLTARLRDLIGEKHRVGWNMVRLFRPGYSPGDAAGAHRFFRRAEIDMFTGVPFAEWLSSHLRREATFLIAPDKVVRERLRAIERRQADVARSTVETALEQLQPQVGELEYESLTDAISLLIGELATLQDRLAESEVLSSSYETELEQARDEIYRLRARIAGLEAEVRGVAQAALPTEVMDQPTTVLEAVQQVQATIQDGELVLDERVMRQVAKIRSGLDPVQVRNTLSVIRDVARCCREGHGAGRSIADLFRERGITLKTDISDTAKQRYAEDYTLDVEHGGEVRRVLMGPHVDLSVRHRIYWYHDRDARRFIIGHIGNHLRDASTR